MRICENCVYNLKNNESNEDLSFGCEQDFCMQEKLLFGEEEPVPVLKCGHTAYATKTSGEFYCPICDCSEKIDKPIDLKNRFAVCDCGKKRPSSFNLPFFQSQPNSEFDSFYCGHDGWN